MKAMNEHKPVWHVFPGRQALARNLAATVSGQLGEAIFRRGQALLVISGGSTPSAFFDALSREKIAWDKVTITLADERFVPADHPRSNERLAKERLLRNEAARASLIGLHSGAERVVEAARIASGKVSAMRQPFDVVMLGMGLDGHTASIFPDAENLAELVAADTPEPVLPVRSRSAGETRLSLTLAWLRRASHIYLHIEGQEKRELLEACLSGKLEPKPPIASLFAQAEMPIGIYWAPTGEPS